MCSRNHWLRLAAMTAGLILVFAAFPGDQPAYGQDEIRIGNTNPYSGPASSYGTIGRAIGFYFNKVNDEGGINGRKINYISYDDGYSPPRTVEQIRKLVEQDRVHLLFQTLGTPTNSAIHKYVNKKKIPHLFVATGATKWGNPKEYPWTMGWQPNYQTVSKIFAQYVIENVPGARIGILYQNDDYGKDYLYGFKAGLAEGIERAGLTGDQAPRIVMEQSYEVTDPTIDSQIINLKTSGANVFFNISIPKFAAQAIKRIKAIGWDPLHIINDVSTSIDAVLRPAGLENAIGLISAQYIKDPASPEWADDPGMIDFLKFMDKYVPAESRNPAFTVYAYSVSQTLVYVLERCGDDLSRENIMRQAANIRNLELPMLLPGIKINTGPDDFYPIEQMQMQRFDGEKWVRFGDLLSAG